MFPQNAAVNDLAFHVFALDGANAQLNEAIGEQDARARLNLPGERFKGRGNQRACAGNLARSNRDPGARLESDRSAVFQTSSADFGALKVLENADGLIFRDSRLAHSRDQPGLLLLRAMREIQTRHIHAVADQLANHRRSAAGGTECANNLSFASDLAAGRNHRRSAHYLIEVSLMLNHFLPVGINAEFTTETPRDTEDIG